MDQKEKDRNSQLFFMLRFINNVASKCSWESLVTKEMKPIREKSSLTLTGNHSLAYSVTQNPLDKSI